MRVIVGSDERAQVVDEVVSELKKRGNEVTIVGPPAGEDAGWVEVSRRLACAVATGEADTGVLFCWTGTGASMAANKVRGIRAALCTDPQTAAGARKWNDANVLVMSLRLTTPAVATEMLDAWFVNGPDPSERTNIAKLEEPRHHDVDGSVGPLPGEGNG